MTKTIDMKASMKAGIGSLKTTGLFGQPMKPIEPDQFPVIETIAARHNVDTRPGAERVSVNANLRTVAVPMAPDVKDVLDDMAKKISRNPMKKSERITANTVVRCLLELVLDVEKNLTSFDALDGIQSPDDLRMVLKNYIKELP